MLSTTLDLEANPFISMLKRVDSAVAGFHGRIVTFGAAFSGISAAVGMVGNAFSRLTGFLDLGGHLTDLSAATGESKSELLVLEQAFKNAGLGAEGVSGFVAKLHKGIGGLNDEGKSTAAALTELGTSAEELRSLPVTEQVKKLSAGFAGIEDPARRGQAAMNLFGKSGESLLAVFRDPEAIGTARTQVGGLAGMIDKLAPILDTVGDAIGALHLKFYQLVGGAMIGAGLEFTNLADAINRLDLTNLGTAIGQVARALMVIGDVVRFLVPVVLSLGAGWAASAALTSIASVSMVGAVARVTTATVAGVRSIMASLGPVGLAVAGLTFLWMKFHKTAEKPLELPALADASKASSAASGDVSKLGVGGMTSRGLNAFAGFVGATSDPLVRRVDQTNALLRSIDTKLTRSQPAQGTPRPDLPV